MSAVPYDRPLAQFRGCDGNSHPEIPPVRVFKNIASFAKHAVILVVNTTSDDCNRQRNPLRTLYYNMISMNGWKNPVFLEAVELSLNIAFLFSVKRKFNTDEECLRAAVKVTNALMASRLATEHPTIVKDIPPNIQNDVRENIKQLVDIKKEIASSMNSDGSYNAVNGWGNGSSNGWGSSNNSGWGSSDNSGWGNSSSGWSNGASDNSSWGNSSSGSWTQSNNSNGWGSSDNSGWGSIAGNTSGKEVTPEDLTAQRLAATPSTPPPAPVPPPVPNPTPIPPVPATAALSSTSKIVMNLNTDANKTEMDRAKHRILVLGQETTGEKAYEGWRTATAALASTSIKAKDQNLYVHPRLLTEANLDSAIAYAKMHALANIQDTPEFSPYRVYAVYFERVTALYDQGDTWVQLKSCSSLAELSLRLGNYAKAVNQTTTSERGRRAHTAFLHAINNHFTKIVNHWLNYRAGLPKVRIDSFMDDIKALYNLLDRKYQTVGDLVTTTLEDPILQLLDCSQELEKKLIEAGIIGGDCPENLYEYFLPVSCSITYSPMLQCEIGYNVNTDAATIEPEKFPVLWDTVNSLAKHSKEINIKPLKDLLVTADNETYHVSSNLTRRGENFIYRL